MWLLRISCMLVHLLPFPSAQVLGFPLQLLGVLTAPILVVRYLLDGKDAVTDVVDTVTDISKRLPGLDK